jgi:hypothetical protein
MLINASGERGKAINSRARRIATPPHSPIQPSVKAKKRNKPRTLDCIGKAILFGAIDVSRVFIVRSFGYNAESVHFL